MSTPQQFPGQQGPGQQFPGQQGPGQQYVGPQVPGQQYVGQPLAAGVQTAPPVKPKKPLLKRWWFWALALVALIAIGSAMSQGGSKGAGQAGQQTAGSGQTQASAAPAPKKEKLTLDDGWALDKSNQFAAMVNGYVTNNTDKAITNYVQITFDALDAKGANLGTCLANTNTIDAGGKWKFKALCSGDAKEVATVRFKEITGF